MLTTTMATRTTIATDDEVDDTGRTTTMTKITTRTMTPALQQATRATIARHWQRIVSHGRGQGNKITPPLLVVNNISSHDPWLAIFWNERK